MYIATGRPLARILLLLLLYKKVLDLHFPAVATTHLKRLIFLETELIVKLNFLLGEDLVNLYHTKEVQAFLGGDVQERGGRIHKHGTLLQII